MEILDGQQFRFAGLHPFRGGGGLALGAVAVAAGVVGDLLVAALVALLDVAAQAAVRQAAMSCRARAAPGEPVAVSVEEGVAVFAGRRRRLRAGVGSWPCLTG